MQQQTSLFETLAEATRPLTPQDWKAITTPPEPKKEPTLDEIIQKKFRHLSNRALVSRINGLPDFKWDDEGYELSRRVKASNGKFEAKMQGNTIIILKDEK